MKKLSEFLLTEAVDSAAFKAAKSTLNNSLLEVITATVNAAKAISTLNKNAPSEKSLGDVETIDKGLADIKEEASRLRKTLNNL